MNRFVGKGIVALAMVAVACSSSEISTSPPGVAIPVVRLRSDPYSFTFYSGMTVPARLVVRDAVTWQAVWAQVYRGMSPVPPTPSIDFSQEMVIVAALGTYGSGGYGILVDGASEADAGGAAIAIRSNSPGPSCVVTLAFTQPVDIARMPRRDGAVTFVERSSVTNCG
jgi:PrcB C-terminal